MSISISTLRLIAIPYLIIINPAKAAENEKNLCRPTEIEIASYQLKRTQGKTASLCVNIEKGTASCSFGKKEKIELNIEFSETRKIYRWFDLSTYKTFLGFKNGEYPYIFGIP
jgi:hypothetical protein